MSHTPGPWTVQTEASPININEVASVGSYLIDCTAAYGETLDDARLIAAAPDLLAALEAVEWTGEYPYDPCPWCGGVRPYKHLGTDGAYHDTGGHAPDCPRQAALRKARGE